MNELLRPQTMALLIPMILIVATAAVMIAVTAFRHARRRRFFELYHQERMAAIAKGLEVPALPDGLLCEGLGPRTPGAVLLKGLIWLSIGVPLFFAMQEVSPRESFFALVPVGIGLAYLIYYFL